MSDLDTAADLLAAAIVLVLIATLFALGLAGIELVTWGVQ